MKHKRLGLVVMIGLIIIALPFFQSTKEMSPDLAFIESPPFPAQPASLTALLASNDAASAAPIHLTTPEPINPLMTWAIQLGSFDDRISALRLVNQLRLRGYRAFAQEALTSHGETLRIFVGPENQHTEALALSLQLAQELHLKGVIVNYHPLAM